MSLQSEGATVRKVSLLRLGIALLFLIAGVACGALNHPGLAPAQVASVPPPPTITATLSPGMATLVSRWATSDAERTPTPRLRASATPSSTREPTPTEFSFPILSDPDADPTLWANMATASAICQFWSNGYEASPDGAWHAVDCLADDHPSRYRLLIVRAGSLSPLSTLESHQFGHNGAAPYVFHWSKDGRTVYISASDYGPGHEVPAHNLALFRVDLTDGNTSLVVPPSSDPWQEIALSPDENTLAIAYHINGAPALELRDLPTNNVSILRLDSSFSGVSSMRWHPGSGRLALDLRSMTYNNDEELVGGRSRVVVVDLAPPRITYSLPDIDRLLWLDGWASRNLLRVGSWLPQQDESEDEIQLIDLAKQTVLWRATVTPGPY